MHGGLALHTLLPLTNTHIELSTTDDINAVKIDRAEGIGLEPAGSAHYTNTHQVGQRWERWQSPLSTNNVCISCVKTLAERLVETDALSKPKESLFS